MSPIGWPMGCCLSYYWGFWLLFVKWLPPCVMYCIGTELFAPRVPVGLLCYDTACVPWPISFFVPFGVLFRLTFVVFE